MVYRMSITAATLIQIDGDTPITWAEFCIDNEECFDADYINGIAEHLENDGFYKLGGGAGAEFSITLA